jgi:hypothetical protein
MCNPVVISLAMTAAGSAAQAAGQAKARKAMQDAREAERIRQAGLTGQSNELISESLAHADRTTSDKGQAAAEAKRNADYAAAAASTPSATAPKTEITAGDTNANKVIDSESAARSAAALGLATQQGGAKAALQGFSDKNLSDILYNNRMLQRQNTIGNFMQGSAGVLPYEIDAASRKGNGLKSLGDILNIGGAAVGMGAGSGWFNADPNAITSSVDMTKLDPTKFQSTYNLSSTTNPMFAGINKPFDSNWINGWMKANNITPPIR